MRYLVHLYVTQPEGRADPALPGFVGEYDVEADAAAAVRARYPHAFASPPVRADGECYIFLHRDHRLIRDETLVDGAIVTDDATIMTMMDMPCGRVVALVDGAEALAPNYPPFDYHHWMPERWHANIAASLATHIPIDAS